jgi:hypothetical protein
MVSNTVLGAGKEFEVVTHNVRRFSGPWHLSVARLQTNASHGYFWCVIARNANNILTKVCYLENPCFLLSTLLPLSCCREGGSAVESSRATECGAQGQQLKINN